MLGGIEASLRRIAHYDAWSNRVRRSVLIDAKADLLLYGMADNTVLEIAERLREGRDVTDVRGLCYAAAEPKPGLLELPSCRGGGRRSRRPSRRCSSASTGIRIP